jgi:UDP-N-acetylmuramoyl-tripeptide--D-alanyl-D-alanine ligase
MRAAIENFEKIHADSKVLILGGMAELGEDSLREHEEIVKLIDRFKWKDVVLVGGDFLKIRANHKIFSDSVEAKAWLNAQKFENAYLLIKGSRSMQMEKVLEEE